MDDYSREVRREARITRKLLRLRTDQPFCIYCGVTDCRCLLRPDDDSMLRCQNCQAKRLPLPEDAAARRLAVFRGDGYYSPSCVVCGEDDLRALEREHLAGEANSAFVEPMCLNCHAMKSDEAEDEPWASLRLRDPERPALVLQAAFEFGLAVVLGLLAAASHDDPNEAAQAVFFGLAAAALIAWALWNLAADEHFKHVLGPGYDRAIRSDVPR
jgi:hypothetical protein